MLKNYLSFKTIILIGCFLFFFAKSKSQCTYASSQSISAATFLACGSITINPAVTLTVTGAVTNNTAGLNINVTDNGSLVFASGVTLNNSGNLSVTGTGSMSIGGSVTLNSTGSFTDGVNTAITGSVTVANSGSITMTSTVTVSGSVTENSSGGIVDNGYLNISGNYNLQNSAGVTGTGSVTVGGTASSTSSGTFFGSSHGCTGCTFSSSVSPVSTYTWNVNGGGSFSTTTNWTPTTPSGGPEAGSNIVLKTSSATSANITAVPAQSFNSITLNSGANCSFLLTASSSQSSPVTITNSLTVASSYTLAFGASGERLCVTIASTATATVNGWLMIDAGSTCRTLNLAGIISVGANGLITDPSPTTGDDFQTISGATMKVANTHGLPDVSNTTTPSVGSSSVAVWMDGNGGGGTCGSGNGAGFNFATGTNYEFNGVATQTVGLGMTMNGTTNPANITISNTTGPVNLSGNVTMTGNLVIAPSATLNTNGYSLSIAGTFSNSGVFNAGASAITMKGSSFVNNGTYNAGTSTITFSASAAQTLSGTVTPTFYNLTIKNTSASGVTLSNPANVSSTLALTSGLLNTDATNILTMQNGSTAPALTAASTSYINGPMIYQLQSTTKTILNLPIGVSPDCRPAKLTVQHTTAATSYNYQCQVFAANPWTNTSPVSTATDMPSTCDTISGVHYWEIDRTDNSGSQPTANLSGNQTIQLYFGTNDQVYEGSALTVVKTTSVNSTPWIDIGGSALNAAGGAWVNSGAAQAGSVASTSSPTAFNSFSMFTLGSKTTGWNPLPIELLSFGAVVNEEKVDLKWETVTETNNAYFTIEKSKDGKSFTKVIDVPGAGNSTSYRNYAETDYQPYEGTSYYRLKQTDNNGAYKYFNMVPVTFTKNGQQSIVLYPNPIQENVNNLNVKVTGYQNQEVLVVLTNIEGKEFLSKVLLSEENGHIFILEDAKSLPAGSYIVTASSNNKIYNYKIIVK